MNYLGDCFRLPSIVRVSGRGGKRGNDRGWGVRRAGTLHIRLAVISEKPFGEVGDRRLTDFLIGFDSMELSIPRHDLGRERPHTWYHKDPPLIVSPKLQ